MEACNAASSPLNPFFMVSREISLGEALSYLETIKLEDLRTVEQAEFTDAIGAFKYDPSDFHVILMCMLGMTKLKCRVVGHFYNHDLVFMASTSPLSSGIKLICGIGMSKYESSYGVKDRFRIISDMMNSLVLEDECQAFECYVKNSNVETLKMWKIIQKTYRKHFFVSLKPVSVPTEGYTLVSIVKKGM